MQNITNIKLLKYGLLIVVMCFLINIIFYMQFSIDENVFLKHYYDIEIHEGTFLELHFISNSYDNKDISRISFPQMPEDFAFFDLHNLMNSNNGYFRTEKFAHYKYNVVYLEIHIPSHRRDIRESIVLDKALIEYSNGERQEVEIGKIILHKNIKTSDSFDTTLSSSSNNHTSTSVLRAKKDVVIDNIKSDLDNETKGILELKMDDTITDKLNYPIHVKSKNSLVFDSQFKFDSEDVRKYNIYEIQKRIFIRDEEGNISYRRLLNINYNPIDLFLKETGIKEYLNIRGLK